ncbi:hypothetical protein EJ02DRAFT_503367 [Clathrospora elynae]|uniref:Uncharacterized protein n=1 Tax=Clathrospora elynae TaxID=706981 RepID=A0A6A5SSM8_9PLEO|nr:hypothetical protein EJ02DRAFT_503367 [Clathrospora elynae]
MVAVATANLFLALIILTSTILVLILVYFLTRFINRHKAKAQHHPDLNLNLNVDLDLEDGRQTRFSHRFSRQQIHQEHYEDPQQRCSSVPPSPSIELLPEIKTSSSDDRANQWLEQGKVDEGVDVAGGDLGQKEAPKAVQVMGMKQKKEVRWDCRTGNMDSGDGLLKFIKKTDGDGMVCREHAANKPVVGGA